MALATGAAVLLLRFGSRKNCRPSQCCMRLMPSMAHALLSPGQHHHFRAAPAAVRRIACLLPGACTPRPQPTLCLCCVSVAGVQAFTAALTTSYVCILRVHPTCASYVCRPSPRRSPHPTSPTASSLTAQPLTSPLPSTWNGGYGGNVHAAACCSMSLCPGAAQQASRPPQGQGRAGCGGLLDGLGLRV